MHRHVRTALTTLLVSATYYLGGIADTHPASPNRHRLVAQRNPPGRVVGRAEPNVVGVPARSHGHPSVCDHDFPARVTAVACWARCSAALFRSSSPRSPVRRVAGGPPAFDSLRSLITFVLLAVIAVPSVIATLVASLFLLTGWVSNFWIAWRLWFLSDALPTLTVTPLVLLVVTRGMTGLRGAAAPIPRGIRGARARPSCRRDPRVGRGRSEPAGAHGAGPRAATLLAVGCCSLRPGRIVSVPAHGRVAVRFTPDGRARAFRLAVTVWGSVVAADFSGGALSASHVPGSTRRRAAEQRERSTSKHRGAPCQRRARP